jgi:HSP20 family protein
MKTQQALEVKQTETPNKPAENPIFVEAEKLVERMEDLTKSIAKRAYEFFEERGRRFGNELEDWFRAESEMLRPVPVTMKEAETSITVQAEVPGFKAGEIKISAEPKRLIIEGNAEQTAEEKSEKLIFSERRSNHFYRLISLPSEIDPATVTAGLKDGVLEITLPKVPARASAVPVEIAVKAA